MLDWLCFVAPLATYLSASVPLFLEEIMPSSGGGNVAEGLMSTLAYGWVERCSDIAGCGTSSVQDKCSFLHNCSQLYFLHCNCLMECDEHVAVLN